MLVRFTCEADVNRSSKNSQKRLPVVGFEGEVLGDVFRYQSIPLYGLFDPKRSILIFKMCMLAAESCHGATIQDHVHIAPLIL
jgi:hypothetical protein